MGFLIKRAESRGKTPAPIYGILANYELEKLRDPSDSIDHVYNTSSSLSPSNITARSQGELWARIMDGERISRAESKDYLNKAIRFARQEGKPLREVAPGMLYDDVNAYVQDSVMYRHAANKFAAQQVMKQYEADKIKLHRPGSWWRPWSEDYKKYYEALQKKQALQQAADEFGKQKNESLEAAKAIRNNPTLLRKAEQAKFQWDSLKRLHY